MRYWETPPSEYLWKIVLTIAALGFEITYVRLVRDIAEWWQAPGESFGACEAVIGTGVIGFDVGFILGECGHDVAQESALAGRGVDVHI
jgi:hypothetical protein